MTDTDEVFAPQKDGRKLYRVVYIHTRKLAYVVRADSMDEARDIAAMRHDSEQEPSEIISDEAYPHTWEMIK